MKARQSPIQGFREPILPTFEGSPYLLTQIIPTLYHIILLPNDMGFTKLRVLVNLLSKVFEEQGIDLKGFIGEKADGETVIIEIDEYWSWN